MAETAFVGTPGDQRLAAQKPAEKPKKKPAKKKRK